MLGLRFDASRDTCFEDDILRAQIVHRKWHFVILMPFLGLLGFAILLEIRAIAAIVLALE